MTVMIGKDIKKGKGTGKKETSRNNGFKNLVDKNNDFNIDRKIDLNNMTENIIEKVTDKKVEKERKKEKKMEKIKPVDLAMDELTNFTALMGKYGSNQVYFNMNFRGFLRRLFLKILYTTFFSISIIFKKYPKYWRKS